MKELLNGISEKGSFLTKTFATLIAQLLVTFLVAYSLRSYPNVTIALQKWYWGLVMFILMILIIFAMFSKISITQKLVLFTVFSALFGLSLSSINASYSIVSAAILGTVGIFIGMFMIGYVLNRYGYDLSWMSGILLVLLLGLIVASIVSFACGVPSNQISYIYISLVVFSLYVMYDTNIMLRKDYFGDFTNAAMSYYLDILNIFVDLLRLFNR